MPGVEQISVDVLAREVKEQLKSGVPSVILFGIPPKKDARGSGAYAKNGIVQQAVKAAKDAGAFVITDVCLCEYTDHGHCGVVAGGTVDNDATLELLARTAVSQADAGADMVAPSAMMDGQVRAIRQALDAARHQDVPILAYSAKYASAFYGPFRQAAESAPRFGDRRSYQMDYRNSDEALREIRQDIEEGADVVMVKPALAYLDVIRRARQEIGYPLAAYNVSGEYALVKAAAMRGWVDERAAALEILIAIKRAGANLILTYWARQAAAWL